MTKNEALDLFEENIPEIEKSLRDNWAWRITQLRKPNAKNSMLFRVQSWRYILEKEELRKQFQPTLRLIELRSQPKKENTNMITDEDIQKAKEYPLESLLPEEVKRGMTLCPLHNEKSPSFQVKKNNTWVCYGCGEHGDSIDLYQKLNNTSFLEAVRNLQI